MESTISNAEIQVRPLQRNTLQEGVYRQVAGLILDGGISPGQLVTIQGLAEAFGVSAMPVREALKRLTAANALTVVSGRSMGIPPLTLERLTDLRNVRRVLEGTAVSWAVQNSSAELIARLGDHVERMEVATAAGDTKAYLQANRSFHFEVYRSAQSQTLNSLIEILWLQISPYFNLLRESGNYASSNQRHRDFFQALQMRDAAAAQAAITGDIEDSFAVLSDILSS